MEISYEQTNIFIISAIIGSIIYILIYNKKGKDKSVQGYFQALGNCFTLSVAFVFLIFGFFFIKVCLTQPLYEGLIVPIVFFFIIYTITKNVLNNDFGLNIHILNNDLKILNIIKEKSKTIFLLVFTVTFAFCTFTIFKELFISIKNQSENCIVLVIVGLIFLLCTIFLGVLAFLSEKVLSLNVKLKLKNIAEYVFVGIFILAGIIALYFGIKKSVEYNNKFSIYNKTDGTYIGYGLYSEPKDNDDTTTYRLLYSYEVDGEEYNVWTDYGTGGIPKYGTMKTILYNPNNPSEAIIEGNFSGKFLIWFGVIFIIVPLIFIFYKIIEKLKKHILKQRIEYLIQLLISIGFIPLGIGGYCALCASGNDYSLKIAFQNAGFWVIIPIVFILTGIINSIWMIYHKIKYYKKKDDYSKS